MKLTKNELIDMLEEAAGKQEAFYLAYKDADNPQVRDMTIACHARADAFYAVRDALQGKPVLLRIYRNA